MVLMPALFGGCLANQASFTINHFKRRSGSALPLLLKFHGPRVRLFRLARAFLRSDQIEQGARAIKRRSAYTFARCNHKWRA
jgi:hypothetical protein